MSVIYRADLHSYNALLLNQKLGFWTEVRLLIYINSNTGGVSDKHAIASEYFID